MGHRPRRRPPRPRPPWAAYRYDSAGRLRQSWDPRIGQQAETQYAYDEGRVTWYQPSGELP